MGFRLSWKFLPRLWPAAPAVAPDPWHGDCAYLPGTGTGLEIIENHGEGRGMFFHVGPPDVVAKEAMAEATSGYLQQSLGAQIDANLKSSEYN